MLRQALWKNRNVFRQIYIHTHHTCTHVVQDASFEPRRLTPRLLAADGGDIATCCSTESLGRDIFCIDSFCLDVTSSTFEQVLESLQWPRDVQVPSPSTPSLLLAHPVWKGRCAGFKHRMQFPSGCVLFASIIGQTQTASGIGITQPCIPHARVELVLLKFRERQKFLKGSPKAPYTAGRYPTPTRCSLLDLRKYRMDSPSVYSNWPCITLFYYCKALRVINLSTDSPRGTGRFLDGSPLRGASSGGPSARRASPRRDDVMKGL